MKKSLFIIGFVILFCNVLSMSFSAHTSRRGFLPHNPIYINGDENFTSENGVTSGSGTLNNPFIIEDWQINSSENLSHTGILIVNTTSYFIIRNCSMQELPYAGINLTSVINGRIESCSIDSHTYSYPNGICLNYCSSSVISSNKVGAFTGILLNNCKSDIITENTIEGTWLYEGIRAQFGCFNLIFSNNTIRGFWGLGSDGFTVYGDNNTLVGNTIQGIGDGGGIYGGVGKNIRIENNIIIGCAVGGLLQSCSLAHIAYNDIQYNSNGFILSEAKDCIVENNTVKYNTNEWNQAGGLGLDMNSSNITLRYNVISHVSYGICFTVSSKNFVYNNQILNTYYGICFADVGGLPPGLDAVRDNLIHNNIITANNTGIYLSGHSEQNTFTLNSINGSVHDVFLQDWSKDNQFIQNNFLSHNQSAHCYFSLHLNSIKEVFSANYWSGPHTAPVVIHGRTGIFRWMLIPFHIIETNPATIPYRILC